jgi:hypothetical protein
MLRPVSDYRYRIVVDLVGGEQEEHNKCSSPRWDEICLLFDTLDGTTHVFNLDHVEGFRFKQEEKK